MNDKIIKQISNDLKIKEYQVQSVLNLLADGNTIPFIARYRKEQTGALSEVIIKEIADVYKYQENLLKKKEDIIRLIDEKGLLTEGLKNNILVCEKLVELEDIYRPFKEKKKTKATDAINNGLEPFAKMIINFGNVNVLDAANNFKCKIDDPLLKIEGAKYIIAEWISDNASYRKWIRNYIFNNGDIISKKKKDAKDEKLIYEMYYDFSEKIKSIKEYRILALNRGESEKILNVNLNFNKDDVISYLKNKIIKNDNVDAAKYVFDAILDSFKRLIYPSIEREIRSDLTNNAMIDAINNFSLNLEKLLMTPPMKEIVVLGFDPAYRTGCKLAVVDKLGTLKEVKVIYPHEPKNEKEKSEKVLLDLIDKYHIDVISIGNGTASRESEEFVANVIKNNNLSTKYIIVSEAGASIYSASKLAISEFPSLDVSERSAISIARRLQDPLSELVKIDPKGIGVGLYQHDVKAKELDESLNFTVSKIVNQVGVNINTASASILDYISGLTKKNILELLKYKEEKGKISSRDEIKKIKSINDKIFEQSIGFLRINNGTNPLDKTNIHPESYNDVYFLLKHLNLTIDEIGKPHIIEVLDDINIEDLSKKLNIDFYTLNDIIKSLKTPLLDPRDSINKPILKSDILKIEDLKTGMKLQGTVRNVVPFGAFVDIGLKNDGLIHISSMSDKFIKHPSEILNVGDIIDCYVKEIFVDKNKVALSLLEIK